MGRTVRALFSAALLLLPAGAVRGSGASGGDPPSIEPLSLELQVTGSDTEHFLDVEATLRFRRLTADEPVRMRLRAEYVLQQIVDADGEVVAHERNYEWITVREPESAPGTERVWTIRYRWPLYRPLSEVDGIVSYTPWYPRVQARPVEEDPLDLPVPATIRIDLPRPWITISAGQLEAEPDEDSNLWVWNQPRARLVHPLVAGSFEITEEQGVEGTCRLFFPVGVPPPQVDLASYVSVARHFFTDMIGNLGAGDYAVAAAPLPELQRGMTVSGMTILRQDILESRKPFPYRTVAHELSHNWWNLGVVFPRAEDGWLKEGLPTYSAIMFVEHHLGQRRFEEELRNSREIALQVAPTQPLIAGYNMGIPEVIYSQIYHKAAWVLHMLRARLGDEEFKAFLRDFFTNYQGKTATTADFERLAVIRDPSLASFFDYWLREPALPGFQVNWSPKKAGDQWRIRGRVRQTRPYLSTPITLRLTFRNLEPLDTTIDIEGRNTSFEVMAPAPPSGLELDPEFEILHYSVAVDKK
jgi:hypothetical protein